MWVEDFADPAVLETGEECGKTLAEFQIAFLGVQAEEVVEDDFGFVGGTSLAAELGGIGQQHQAGEFGVRSQRLRRFAVGDDRVRAAEPSVVVVWVRSGYDRFRGQSAFGFHFEWSCEMSLSTISEVVAFHQFLGEHLGQGTEWKTPEQALDSWRRQRPIPQHLANSVAAVREAVDAMQAGDRGRPAAEVIAQMRAKLAAAARS